MNKNKIAVIELFAGVGGFRLGLEGVKRGDKYYSSINRYEKEITDSHFFGTGYANQYEPGRKQQFAADVYKKFYADGVMDNTDIADVSAKSIIKSIKDKKLTDDKIMLVGGFPCQDYSVANGLHTSKGLLGRKGVLWWEIYRLIKELKVLKRQPEILLLENVDRLLVSPAKQRGRDFAIMLYTLSSLGYTVEYKVINAAEYDFPQKRKRVFILAYLKGSPLNHEKRFHHNICNNFTVDSKDNLEKISLSLYKENDLMASLSNLEDNFRFKESPFGNAGICTNFNVYPFKEKGSIGPSCATLGEILIKDTKEVPKDYYVTKTELEKWEHYKGAKKILRYKPNGETYFFAEGKMNLYDPINKPSRTIITSEGGKSGSRTKHLIQVNNVARRLLPVELERLNMFPDNITKNPGVSDTQRAFMMGNALVIGVVEKFRNLIIEKYG